MQGSEQQFPILREHRSSRFSSSRLSFGTDIFSLVSIFPSSTCRVTQCFPFRYRTKRNKKLTRKPKQGGPKTSSLYPWKLIWKFPAPLIDFASTLPAMEAPESPLVTLSSTSKWICGGVTSAIVAGLFLWNQTIAMDMLTIFLSAASIVYIWFRGWMENNDQRVIQ